MIASNQTLPPNLRIAYSPAMMSAAEFKRIRESLGLSLADLAEILRVTNVDNLRYIETGKKPASGPIAVIMELLDQGYIDHLRPDKDS